VARPLRLEVADGIYHLIARGNERREIYRDERDRLSFLEILQATLTRYRWRCLGYCLMSNHYHLLVRTPEPNLARGMRDLNGVYAQAFNRRHGRVGHLFQGRYRAILVEKEEQLLATIAYVARNPVRAGMCASADAYRWSSHCAVLGLHPPGLLALGELLAYFAADRASARRRYRELVEATLDESALHGNGVIAGSDSFVRAHLRDVTSDREVPASQRRLPLPPLPELLASRSTADIADAYARGYTMPAIARELGVHPSTVSRRLSRHRAQIKT
jgi:REP element-mobilizing transposase RayT